MTKQVHPSSIFSPSWRSCCRRVVEIYIEIQEEKTGAKFGSTRLARAMRELHILPGNDWANAQLEEAFTRQDVEAWLNRGVEFSDAKFKFVDAFVRYIAVDQHGKEIRQLVLEERERMLCGALWTVFGNSEGGPTHSTALLAEGTTFRTSTTGAVSQTCILVINKCYGSVMSAGLVFFSHGNNFVDLTPEEKIKRQISSAKLLHAYFIPTASSTFGRTQHISVTGTALVRDPSLTAAGHRVPLQRGTSIIGFRLTDSGFKIITNPAILDAILFSGKREETSPVLMLELRKADTSFYDDVLSRATAGYLI